MAKKKNAPVLRNNLRNEPAEKFRTVNRMNGIVTMIEYTSEDDIKAYELEPTYRELTGGGESDWIRVYSGSVTTTGDDPEGIIGEIGELFPENTQAIRININLNTYIVCRYNHPRITNNKVIYGDITMGEAWTYPFVVIDIAGTPDSPQKKWGLYTPEAGTYGITIDIPNLQI